MVRLKIRHRTTYRYARAVTLQPHRMLLRPRSSESIDVSQTSLQCTPPADIAFTRDVFDNLVATATFTEASDTLVIDYRAQVTLFGAEWPIFRIDTQAHVYPFEYAPDDAKDLGAFRTAGKEKDVEDWVSAFTGSGATDTLSLLKSINAGILDKVAYRIRDEEGTQTASETLAIGSGSCRDVAALFIEAVRSLGFGARAVSGYLYNPDTPPDDDGSTHAWADVFLPGAGWISFDPTNRRVGSAHLIPVGVGRRNSQIMPIVGGYLGAPDDFRAMDVSVKVDAILQPPD